jgi:hypothetical protein
MKMPERKRDMFEYWLTDMAEAIDESFKSMPSHVRDKIDYTPDSLDVMEKHIIDIFDSPKSALEESQAYFLDGIARYVGQVFRKSLGGKWDIELEDIDNAFYNIPQLVDMKNQDTQISPLALVTASLDRRRGNYIRTVLEAHRF